MYAYKKECASTYEEAIERVKTELQNEGFGVLTEIDVKATLKKKLNVDIEKYIILGACNPHLAHHALQIEHDMGLLLPCNLVVYEQEKKVFVAAVMPTQVHAVIIKNPELTCIAQEVESKLKHVVDAVK